MSKYTDLGVKIGGLISQTADELIRQNDFVVDNFTRGDSREIVNKSCVPLPSTGFIGMFRIVGIDENYSD